MRGPAHVDIAVEEEERCSLGVLGRIEDYVAVLGVIACAGIGCGDFGWAAGDLRSSGDVECMQALVICAGCVLAHADGEERAVLSLFAVDYGRCGDSDLGRDL